MGKIYVHEVEELRKESQRSDQGCHRSLSRRTVRTADGDSEGETPLKQAECLRPSSSTSASQSGHDDQQVSNAAFTSLLVPGHPLDSENLQSDRMNITPRLKVPAPCEYFDLICGTGFGAVLAVMLGRLRMV